MNRSKWKSPLLLLVLSLLLFESVSGFVLFFFGELIPNTRGLVVSHWVGGFLTLLPYAIYQWRHYIAVKNWASQFHYQLGLYTFASLCVVTISGLPLLAELDRSRWPFIVIELAHVVSSFAFLILISGHLVLVAKVTLGRREQKEAVPLGTLKMLGMRVLWVPLIATLLIFLLLSLLS